MGKDCSMGWLQPEETLFFLTSCWTRSREKMGQSSGIQNPGTSFRDPIPLASSPPQCFTASQDSKISWAWNGQRHDFVKCVTYKPHWLACCSHFKFGEKQNLQREQRKTKYHTAGHEVGTWWIRSQVHCNIWSYDWEGSVPLHLQKLRLT